MQVSELVKQHNDFFNFLDKDIIPRLEGFARGKKIKITDYNFNNEGRKSIALSRVDDSSEGVLMLTTSTKGFGSKIWGNYKDGQNCETEFEPGSKEDKFFKFIVRRTFNYKTHGKRGFTVKGLKADFQELRRRPEFPKILLQKDIKESNLTEECEYSIKTTPDSIEHEAQATNSSTAATIALGLTTLTTILAPIVNNTIPAISDQNSTNTSTISTNDSFEQGDHLSTDTIMVIAGGVFLAVMCVCIPAVRCCYKNYRKRHIIGTYNMQGVPECIPISEKQKSSFCEVYVGSNTRSNKRPLATTKEEGELLLPDQGQSGSGISIPDNTSTGMQQPGPSGVKQEQQEKHVVVNVEEQREDSSSLPHTAPKTIGTIPKKPSTSVDYIQSSIPKNEQEKYEERGGKADATYIQLDSTLKDGSPLSAVTSTTVTGGATSCSQHVFVG